MAHRRPTGLILPPVYPVLAQSDSLNLGLVGAWGFSEGGGAIARDLTGRTNGALTAYTTAQWVPGPKQVGGKALAFNGTSQYVTVTTPIFSAIPAFSFSGWIYQPSRAGAWTPWFNTTDLISGLFIGKFTDGAALLYVGGTSASTTLPAYPTDTWFHLAVSISYFSPSATVVNGWINGVTTGSVGGGVMPAETAFQIAANTANNYYSNCTIANFRIWNRAILPTEAKRLYTTPLAGFVSPKRLTARASTSSGTSVNADFISPSDWLTTRNPNYVASSDWLTTSNCNYVVSSAWMTTRNSNYVASSDWLATNNLNYVISSDWLGSRIYNTINPIDSTITSRVDKTVFSDWNTTAQQDAVDPIEWRASILKDVLAPLEFAGITALILDAPVPIDWRATILRDTPTSSDQSSVFIRDIANVSEFVATVRADKPGVTDWNLTALYNSSVPTEWLVGMIGGAIAPLEFGGIAAIFADIPIPIEWRSVLIADQIIANDHSKFTQSDSIGQTSWVTSAQFTITPSGLIEWRSSLIADQIIANDHLKTTQTDSVGPVSWVTSVQFTIAPSVDWRTIRVGDAISPIDWTSPILPQLTADVVVSIDWTLHHAPRITKGAATKAPTIHQHPYYHQHTDLS